MFSSHVRLAPNPIIWSDEPVAQDAPAMTRSAVFYDSLHQRAIRILDDKVSLASFDDPGWRTLPFRLRFSDSITSAKFSIASEYLSLLLGTTEMRVLDVNTGAELAARGPQAKNAPILAVHWLSVANIFFFVTSHGIEMYSLVQEASRATSIFSFKHIKSATCSNVVRHWYSAEAATVLLVDSKGVFHSFRVRSTAITKLGKLDLGITTQFLHQISLISLYGRTYLSFLNEQSAQLSLFLVGKETTKPAFVYDLFSPSQYALSVHDNILMVHNLHAKIVLLFDIAMDAQHGSAAPVAMPLPISGKDASRYEDRRAGFSVNLASFQPNAAQTFDQSAQSLNTANAFVPISDPVDLSPRLDSNSVGSDGTTTENPRFVARPFWERTFGNVPAHYYEHWKFFYPNIIMDAENVTRGIIWRLEFDFHSISASWSSAHRDKLVEFLLKRSSTEAKLVILSNLRQMVEAELPISSFTRLFNMFNRICKADAHNGGVARGSLVRSASDPAMLTSPLASPASSPVPTEDKTQDDDNLSLSGLESSNGMIIISQQDIFEHVLMKSKPATPVRSLAAVITEYLRSIYRFGLRSESTLNELLIDVLLQDNRHYEFHQLLQYHILNDSLPVARRLVTIGDTVYPPALQLGMDMLYRLHAFGDLLRLLLRKREVLRALRLVSHQSPLFKEPGLAAADFLESALARNSTSVFYSTYKFFEQRNMLLRSSSAFLPEEDCEKFVIHYTHLFGAQ